jgi:hypothetical protein
LRMSLSILASHRLMLFEDLIPVLMSLGGPRLGDSSEATSEAVFISYGIL